MAQQDRWIDQTTRLRHIIYNIVARDYPEILEDLGIDKYEDGLTFENVFLAVEDTEVYFLENRRGPPERLDKEVFKGHLRGKHINERYLRRLYAEQEDGRLNADDLAEQRKRRNNG